MKNKTWTKIAFLFLLTILVILSNSYEVNSRPHLEHSLASLEPITIELASDLEARASYVEGGGEPINPLRPYFFEGDQIWFDVLIYSPHGLNKVGNPYVTVNGLIEANCREDGTVIIDKWHKIVPCRLAVETPRSMQGWGDIKAVVDSTYGEKANVYVGTWYLNSAIYVNTDPLTIEFPDAHTGETVYSNIIKMLSGVELDSPVPLQSFVSTDNQISLENLYYYAENDGYTTLDDPRADSEGFINLFEADHFEIYYFYNNAEIMHSLDILPEEYPGNILEPDGEINLRFRLDVPENWTGHHNECDLYIWGRADLGPNGGHEVCYNINIVD